jgi:GMP synthase (glutamine-hydrolysing)
MRTAPAKLSGERLNRLRRADAIVRQFTKDSGFDASVWQFPVVLIPLGTSSRPDSLVLRPIDSIDGMTASVVRMPQDLLDRLVKELQHVEGIAGIFYDLTNKPPGTIEWE